MNVHFFALLLPFSLRFSGGGQIAGILSEPRLSGEGIESFPRLRSRHTDRIGALGWPKANEASNYNNI